MLLMIQLLLMFLHVVCNLFNPTMLQTSGTQQCNHNKRMCYDTLPVITLIIPDFLHMAATNFQLLLQLHYNNNNTDIILGDTHSSPSGQMPVVSSYLVQ